MKSILVFAAALSVGSFASAKDSKPATKRDIASVAKKSNHVVCGFTEPFFTIDVNVKRKSMKVISPMGDLMDGKIPTERTDEIDGVTGSEANGVWTFVYTNEAKEKTVLLSVNTNKKGSDGMSDKVYDAEGSTQIFSGANNGIGGCNFVR